MTVGRPRKLVGQEQDVVAVYEAGTSLADICEQFGVSKKLVHRILNEAGVARRPAHRPSKLTAEDEARIVELYRADPVTWSLTRLGREFPVARPAIRRLLREGGVEIDSSPGQRPRRRT